MSSYPPTDTATWLQAQILELEQAGRVTRTFRRLDPERQRAVLQAILDEAIERGPTTLNIKVVAARAGVAVGSLYQYFTSRDGLLNFAIELASRYLVAEMNRYRPLLASMPLRDGLAAYLAGGIEWSQGQAGLMRFFARAAYQGDARLAETFVAPLGRVMQETVVELLNAAVIRGEIAKAVDVEAAARAVHVALIAVADSQMLPYLNHYYQATDDRVSFDRLVSALLDLILKGVAP